MFNFFWRCSIRDKKSRNSGPKINEEIRIKECRLTIDGGENRGVVSIEEARRIAEELGVDLVEISPNADPPVVKAIDFGKYKYNLQKKVQEAKKKQVVVQLKEIQFRPNIEEHDLETKLRKIEQFLDQGDKVKMVMQFRGREMAYRNQGMEKFMSIIKKAEVGFSSIIESSPKMMGNRIISILAPTKKKVVKPKNSHPDTSSKVHNEQAGNDEDEEQALP